VFTTANIHTLNGLAPATLYSCSVFATNLYGSGPPANIFAMTADGGMQKYIYHFQVHVMEVTAAKSVLEPILPFWSNFDKQSWWYSYSMLVVMSEGGVSLRTTVISNWSKLCSL